jgi:hypothetical protein
MTFTVICSVSCLLIAGIQGIEVLQNKLGLNFV